METASKSYRKNPTNINAIKLKKAQYQLTGIYLKEQTEYIQNQIDKIRDSVEDRQSRIAWQTINEVSKRKSTTNAKLKVANQQERIKLWKQHFENLLGNPPKVTHEPITRIISKQLDIRLGPFTQEELDSVLKKLKIGKLQGLTRFPQMYGRPDNSTKYNTYIHSSQNLQCPTTKPHRTQNRKNQNGFRRNRSTTSQILTIRRILEGVRAKNLQVTLLFVDFTKAFDSIHRGKMEQILQAYGRPKETVAAIMILYRNTKVKVRSPDGDTEYFDIVAGVLQGDTLAPYLFIICLDYV